MALSAVLKRKISDAELATSKQGQCFDDNNSQIDIELEQAVKGETEALEEPEYDYEAGNIGEADALSFVDMELSKENEEEEADLAVEQPETPLYNPTYTDIEKSSDTPHIAFSVSVENVIALVMEEHSVSNVSLSSFGGAQDLIKPVKLEELRLGKYRFLGRNLTLREQYRFFWEVAKQFFANPERKEFNLKLTREIIFNGMRYTTAVVDETVLERFSEIFGCAIKTNFSTMDEDKLVAVLPNVFC
jgi:hypothetical protein